MAGVNVTVNPSVMPVPGRNTRVVCADCNQGIPLLQIPSTFVVLCSFCWDKRETGTFDRP